MGLNNIKQSLLDSEKVFSVSEYIGILNEGLKIFKAKIIGEVSEVKVWSSGHVYFSLKDEKDGNVINCIIWKSRYNIYGIELKDGLKIIASGYPEIYPPSGRISFIAETIELVGEGVLKKEYEKLKKKLAEEGLFAESRKRKIPAYPRRIGLITSRQGAVLADFLNNLGKFNFKVKMVDSRVEGQVAVADLLLSLKSFKKHDIYVLVIIRGGGSLESMMVFNNEMLVREIVNFPAPVITGIGHHKDVPLVALAADAAVSTPTAAANLLSRSWEQAALLSEGFRRNIIDCFKDILENVKINLKDNWSCAVNRFTQILSEVDQQLISAEKIVFHNNPLRQLQLGYSIAKHNGKIIKSVRNISVGDDIDITLTDGELLSAIKKIKETNKNG